MEKGDRQTEKGMKAACVSAFSHLSITLAAAGLWLGLFAVTEAVVREAAISHH